MCEQHPFGIEPKSYYDGRLLSYRYRNEKTGQDESVGVAAQHTYNFGIATEREVMTVISGIFMANGNMTVISGIFMANGKMHSPKHNPTFVFEVGDEIIFTCLETSSYHCVYGEPK